MMNDPYKNRELMEIYHKTAVVRKPVSGIVSGYHELPYILVAPDEQDPARSLQINGKINVSPKFVISPQQLGETFGEVFDPETFSEDLQGRLFSFAYSNKRNVKVESERFSITNHEEEAERHVDRVRDQLMMQENIKTGLILGPRFRYYPISLDRFISEIMDREFRV
ncbi:MAG: hypothetical protein GF418_15545 [Chitinivibrionales bacterium]|nr:hypothetical protein [Chitinivibrionales bacterium]MBD3397035.1 hypothetical protein [Chitinivibrionales bacterium]